VVALPLTHAHVGGNGDQLAQSLDGAGADPVHFRKLLDRHEGSVRVAIRDDGGRLRRTDARKLLQQFGGSAIEIDRVQIDDDHVFRLNENGRAARVLSGAYCADNDSEKHADHEKEQHTPFFPRHGDTSPARSFSFRVSTRD
jgi:hypothetical protein